MPTVNDVIVTVTANPTSFVSQVDAAFKKAGEKIKGWVAEMNGQFQAFGEGLLGGLSAALIGKLMFDVTKAADEMNTALSRLRILIDNVNPGLGVTNEQLMGMANKMAENTQYIDDDIIPALFKATSITKDFATGIAVTKNAMALATLTGMDLTTATNLVAQAHEGFTMGLSRAGKQVGLNIKEGASYAEIMGEIKKQAEGMGEAMQGSLSVGMRKLQDDTSGLLEDIIMPNLPVLRTFLEYIGDFTKGLSAVFTLLGTAYGTFFGAIFSGLSTLIDWVKGGFKTNLITEMTRTFTAAGEQAALNFGKAWDKIRAMFGDENGGGIPGLGKPNPAKPSAGDSGMTKEEEADLKALEEKLKKEDELQRRMERESQKDTDEYNKAEEEANQSHLDRLMQQYNNYIGMLDTVLRNSLMSGIDTLSDALIGSEVNWKEWAQNVIKEIERVIAKLLIMQALEAILNMIAPGSGTGLMSWLGYATNSTAIIAGANGSPTGGSGGGGKGQAVIQIMPLDNADGNGLQLAFVRRMNNAYAGATARDLAMLNRNVQAGALADIDR